jgi:hypothetical protein
VIIRGDFAAICARTVFDAVAVTCLSYQSPQYEIAGPFARRYLKPTIAKQAGLNEALDDRMKRLCSSLTSSCSTVCA